MSISSPAWRLPQLSGSQQGASYVSLHICGLAGAVLLHMCHSGAQAAAAAAPGNGRGGKSPAQCQVHDHLTGKAYPMTTSKSRGGEYTRATVRLAQGMGIILLHCRDMKTGAVIHSPTW